MKKDVINLVDDSLVMVAILFLVFITVYFVHSEVPDSIIAECEKKGIISVIYCQNA